MEFNKEQVDQLRDTLEDLIKNHKNEDLSNEIKKTQDTIDELDQKLSDSLMKNAGSKNMLRNSLKSLDLAKVRNNEFFVNASTVLPASFGVLGDKGFFNPEDNDAGFTRVPYRQLSILELMNVGPTSSEVYTWYELSGSTNANGAATRYEGGSFGQSDRQWIKRYATADIISAYMKAGEERLNDTTGLESEIRNELFSEVRQKLEDQVFAGGGTGSDYTGLNTVASSFTAEEPWVTGVTAPNIWDACLAAISQIHKAGNGWMPNAIVLNPVDYHYSHSELKISDGRYLSVPFKADGTVYNVPIVLSYGITAGNVMVGDFTKAHLKYVDNLTVKTFDQNEDDALKNIRTITANVRGIFFVKELEKAAFVYDSIADIKTAITAA